MAILKCKMCGAQLTVKPDQKVCTCEYCGSMQTIPNSDDEQKIALYNRANALRMRSDFDKAIIAYQSIITNFPKESEAHWGLCLSKYGIEYVDDPKSGDKIPTCHRTLYESILDDPDYLEALEYSDVISKDIYIAEAKEIDRIQKRIIRISQKEDPYDIFICYKETDDAGGRTVDSVLAQDIYDKLTDKGYKVFFARITLENKLGQEYEPIIFAALRSAKIMLVVGTKEEYFNAVWVKNEWSRFLSFMSDDKNKYLIPCYKDIDAYDMPEEFTPLQSQDMGKIGYLQDLSRGIDKIFGRDEKKVVKVVAGVGGNFSGHYSRIEQAIQNSQFEKADWLIETVLSSNENDAKSYFYKIFVEEHFSDLDHLGKDITDPFNYRNFNIAYKNADPEFKQELDEIVERVKQNQLSTKYSKACGFKNAKDFSNAMILFRSLGDYLDSPKKLEECEKEKAEYEEECRRIAQEKQAAAERQRQITELTQKINSLEKQKVQNAALINKNKTSIAVAKSNQTKQKNFGRLATIFAIVGLGISTIIMILHLAIGLPLYFNYVQGYDGESSFMGPFVAVCIIVGLQMLLSGLGILFVKKRLNPVPIFVFSILCIVASIIASSVFMSTTSFSEFSYNIVIFASIPLMAEWFMFVSVIPFLIFCRKANATPFVRYNFDKVKNEITELEEKNNLIDGQVDEYIEKIKELSGGHFDVSSLGIASLNQQNRNKTAAANRSTAARTQRRNVLSIVMGILNGVFGAIGCGLSFLTCIIALSTSVGVYSSGLAGYSVFLLIFHLAFMIVFIVLARKRPAPGIGFAFALANLILVLILFVSAISVTSSSQSYSYDYYYYSDYYSGGVGVITVSAFAFVLLIVSFVTGLIRLIKCRHDY